MTRSEEIKQQADEYRQPYRDGGYRLSSRDVRDAFEIGAEWADRTMIARFCEWIEEHIENAFVSIDGTMTDINGIELSEVVRKAMEE